MKRRKVIVVNVSYISSKVNRFISFVCFIFLSYFSFAKAPMQEKRIYLVDLTASMEGLGVVKTPDIFNKVKHSLTETIDHISDPNTEIVIIPFTTHPLDVYSGTVAMKDSLIHYVKNLSIAKGDTNIADVWSKGMTYVDSTKVNYMFLLTDGLHNYGPSIEALYQRLSEWGDYSQGRYMFAFYVMLTPNAKEQKICQIIDQTRNLWLIESMDIDASLIKTSTIQNKNIFADKTVVLDFESNNKRINIDDTGISVTIEENPYYDVAGLRKSSVADSYFIDIFEKDKRDRLPLIDTFELHISHNYEKYPFVFFTPDYIQLIITNQGARKLELTTENSPIGSNPMFSEKIKFHEPFQGPFKYLRKHLEPTLSYFPFSCFKPDTATVSREFYFTFNDEAVRSQSVACIEIKDEGYNSFKDIQFICKSDSQFSIAGEIERLRYETRIIPGRKSGLVRGYLIAKTSNVDYLNGKGITSNECVVGDFTIKYKRGWTLLLWLLWVLCALLAIVAVLAIIWLIVMGIKMLLCLLMKMWGLMSGVSYNKHNLNSHWKHRKTRKNEKDDKKVNEILMMERFLYHDNRVVDKYDVLEKMKSLLSEYYNNGREVYEECKARLNPNTWEALEEAWREVYPIGDVEQRTDHNGATFTLKPSNPYYSKLKGFVSCHYDKHGGPDFGKVTAKGSVVDISDLYDSMSPAQIQKRGGGKSSFQEKAQERMASQMDRSLKKWWKANRNDAYNQYDAFYAWRDANDLVPHEDTNCRTMRLVYRPAHKAFIHRGGVSNANNIKNHFGN